MKYFSLLLLAIILTSCLEGDDDSFRSTSNVLFLNVYNDAVDGVDFRVNDREWTYGYRPYDSVGTYNSFYSGDVTFSAFNTAGSSAQAIASASQTLGADAYYTGFLTGKSGEGRMIFLTDTLGTPATGKALVRFANLSPDLSKADIEVADSGKVIFNLDYLTAGYMSIDTGARVIKAYRPGEAVPVATLRFKAEPRGVYTMYTKGLLGWDGKDSLSISYFTQPER